MSDIVAPNHSSDKSEKGTKINRFLANRGVILLKEIKPIGTLKCMNGSKIVVETILVTTAKSSTKPSNKSHAIRFEVMDADESSSIGSLDFDETEEFGKAMAYFHEVSRRIADEERDYTEAIFSTKDDIQVGFFQTTDGEQSAFFRTDIAGGSVFMPTSHLLSLKKLIDSAREHLIRKGAIVDAPE